MSHQNRPLIVGLVSPGLFWLATSVAAGQQPPDDRAAQEAAAAGHEGVHRTLPAAQSANFSRKILALWRISTGKRG